MLNAEEKAGAIDISGCERQCLELERQYKSLQHQRTQALRGGIPAAPITNQIKALCDQLVPLRAVLRRREWNEAT